MSGDDEEQEEEEEEEGQHGEYGQHSVWDYVWTPTKRSKKATTKGGKDSKGSYTHRAAVEPVGPRREPADLADLTFLLDELVEQPWATLDHGALAIDCGTLTGKADPVEPASMSPGGVDPVQLVGWKRQHASLTNPTFLLDKLVELPWARGLRAREPRTKELPFDVVLKLEGGQHLADVCLQITSFLHCTGAHAHKDSTNVLSTQHATQEKNRKLQTSRTHMQVKSSLCLFTEFVKEVLRYSWLVFQTSACLLQTGNLSEVSCLQPIKRRIVSLRHPYRPCPALQRLPLMPSLC